MTHHRVCEPLDVQDTVHRRYRTTKARFTPSEKSQTISLINELFMVISGFKLRVSLTMLSKSHIYPTTHTHKLRISQLKIFPPSQVWFRSATPALGRVTQEDYLKWVQTRLQKIKAPVLSLMKALKGTTGLPRTRQWLCAFLWMHCIYRKGTKIP